MSHLVTEQVTPEKPAREQLARYPESIITNLANWIPNKPGLIVRAALYPRMLAHMGKAVKIESGTDFRGSHQISLGNNVFIGRNASLNAGVLAGRIQIEDNSYVLENASLTCQLDHGTIILREHATVDRGVDIRAIGGCIEIQSSAYIGSYVCMAGPGHITIGKNCLIAAHTVIYATSHVFSDLTTPINLQGTTHKGIVIEDDCWLGAGVKVLDGVTIGRGSVIGAGAVVTRDIPPLAVAVGMPARVIRYRNPETENAPLTAADSPESGSLDLSLH